MCTGFVCWACSHKEPQQQERVRQAFVAVKAAADKAKTTVQVSRGSRGLIRWVVAVIDISTQFSCETCYICWETEDYQIWVFGIHLRDQDWQPIQENNRNMFLSLGLVMIFKHLSNISSVAKIAMAWPAM